MSLRNGRNCDDDMIRSWRSPKLRVCPLPRDAFFGKRKREKRIEAKIQHRPDKTLSTQKSSFDWSIKIVRWISTSGLKLFLQFRYNSTPVFTLPPGWFPYYVEWLLAFPKAPMGSVSVQVWSSVCGVAVRVMAEMVSGVVVWVGGRIQQRSAMTAEGAKKMQ